MRTAVTRAGLALSGLAVLLAFGPPAQAAAVPFTDQNVNASIGLCDDKGNPITSGSIDSHAFVTAAASSAPAPTNYQPSKMAKATLYAFQPRPGVDPGEWSGYQLTGGSVFADGQHPLVSGTNLDPSLRDFMSNYALKWDNLLELRIYYTAANAVVSRRSYPAAVLKVSGNTWTMVQGATNIRCDLTKVVSSERINLPASDFDPRHPAVTQAPAPSGITAPVNGASTAQPQVSSAQAGASGPASAAPTSSAGPAQIVNTASEKKDSSTMTYWVVGGLVVLLGLGVAVSRWIRVARR